MSKFTDYLNLFMWDAIEDAEEELNIDKALNDNWKKIDVKLKTHINNVNQEISNFETEIEQKQTIYETNITNKVNDLEDSISSTQVLHKYKKTITTEDLTDINLTIPCNYKVGQDVLDVYIETEKLLKSSDEEGTGGHYQEVGEIGSISNQIRITDDWRGDLVEGDVLEFVVRGEYLDDSNL